MESEIELPTLTRTEEMLRLLHENDSYSQRESIMMESMLGYRESDTYMGRTSSTVTERDFYATEEDSFPKTVTANPRNYSCCNYKEMNSIGSYLLESFESNQSNNSYDSYFMRQYEEQIGARRSDNSY